jgi:hypothetical protein
MTRETSDSDAAIAALLGIPIADAYRPSVVENLERLFEQARLVMAAPLSPELEPPAEFEP